MRRVRPVALLALVLAACSQAPMPPPAAGTASAKDAMAPSDRASRDAADTAAAAAAAAAAVPPALPPPDLEPAEPVANDLGTAVADNWAGTWRGPEGTYLTISKQEVGDQLVLANLDGPREFHAVAADDVLQFERDGVAETVHAGNGRDTGMKWLADKHDCLIVRAGEAFCRP